MKKMSITVALIAVTMVLNGCESKQDKARKLEAEYDRLNAQYRVDCLGMGGSDAQSVKDAYLGRSSKTPATPVITEAQRAKCKEEKARLDTFANELLKAQQP